MGLIKAAVSSVSGVLSDQWKEFFYCDAIPADVLVVRGKKKVSSKSSNTSADNVISNGSVISVADGQCMLIVDNGKVVDLCAVSGEYKFDASTEPSLLDGGNLGDNIKAVFANVGKRFTFGGETPKEMRVYYFNTKEIMGNKYGTPSPVAFRVVDERAAIDMDISIKCFGEYSYKITNPMLFYTNVCGNVKADYSRTEIDSQLKSEFLTALQPAFARLSDAGIRYSALMGHTKELADALKEELTAEWKDARGIEIGKVGVSSLKASDEDEATIKEMQREAAYLDPTRLAARAINAKADAQKIAAGNAAGAAVGFMGMNMAGNSSDESALLAAAAAARAQGQQTVSAAKPAEGWTCPKCGTVNTGKFCADCGAAKPAEGWTCPKCGAVNKGKFCAECGTPKPAEGWTCSKCGTVNKGKFCSNCGNPQE